jgi:hypothetical protein
VSKVVGADLFVYKAWTGGSCGRDVLGDEALHGVGTEPITAPGRKQGIVGLTSPLAEPRAQELDRRSVERGISALAALAETLEVRSRAELNIPAAQPRELREAKAGP